MEQPRESLKPGSRSGRALRHRLGLKGEFILAFLPTVTVLAVLGLVEALSRQQLLFASLAASAFLIYLDPGHGTNSVRTLVLAQIMAALVGWGTHVVVGPVYLSGAIALVVTITLMILLDAVHPPAVATALSFAFRTGPESNLVLFALAVGITAALVVMELVALRVLVHLEPPETGEAGS